jgi:hypothetical protein
MVTDDGGCQSQDKDGCFSYVPDSWQPNGPSNGLPVTIISAAIILAFSTIEFFDYRRLNMDTSIVVDKSRGQHLTVWLNVTFPRVPCYRASIRILRLKIVDTGCSSEFGRYGRHWRSPAGHYTPNYQDQSRFQRRTNTQLPFRRSQK